MSQLFQGGAHPGILVTGKTFDGDVMVAPLHAGIMLKIMAVIERALAQEPLWITDRQHSVLSF